MWAGKNSLANCCSVCDGGRHEIRSLGSVLLCAPVAAQSGPSPLKAIKKLKGKIVFLRGMEAGNDLSFDAAGNVIGTTRAEPFSNSVLRIDKVRESMKRLNIEGERLVLIAVPDRTEPSKTDFYLARIWKSRKISIAIDPAQPEKIYAAIHRIFSFGMQDDFMGRPGDSVKAVFASLGVSQPPATLPDFTAMQGIRVIDASRTRQWTAGHSVVIPPLVIYSVAPELPQNDPALEKKIRKPFEGFCVLGLVVDSKGIPTNIHIVRSLNPELDRAAIDAVRQYRFLPAIAVATGRPMAASIDVQVAYRIK